MGSDVNLPGRFGIRRKFAQIGLDRAILVTSKSSGMDSSIQLLGDYTEKIRRVTWGVDDRLFDAKLLKHSARIHYGISQDSFVAFSPRSMQPLYRIPEIVKSFLEYAGRVDNSYLILAGMNAEDSVMQQIGDLIRRSSSRSRIIQLPKLSKIEMINCYAASDVMLSYATSDGMPQSLYEGMAVGCFPIFTDLPCYAEILRHKENALLCNTNDPETIWQALLDYHETFTPSQIEEIILKNRRCVKELASRKVQIKMLQNIYKELGGST